MEYASIMEYPKINSLFKREGMTVDPITGKNVFSKAKKHPLIIGDYALPEYGLINEWQVFEKIDGTNIRITYELVKEYVEESPGCFGYQTCPKVRFDGRTKDSAIPTFLYKHLQDTFTLEKMAKVFPDINRVILFGEGYGSKIQNGRNYRDDVSFILFDVFAEGEWWLKYEDRLQIAYDLGIEHVPYLGKMEEQGVIDYVSQKPKSKIAHNLDYVMEGVVCTTDPILRLRSGQPLKFKLRCEDFE